MSCDVATFHRSAKFWESEGNGKSKDQLATSGLIPANVIVLNIGLMVYQEESAIQVPPGTLLREKQICRDIANAFGAMSKADKIRAPPFLGGKEAKGPLRELLGWLDEPRQVCIHLRGC